MSAPQQFRSGQRYSIFDALAARGAFALNPANPDSRDNEGLSIYKGPVEYPKMLYHPQGETRQVVAPEVVVTPMGPKEVGEQRELISKEVANREEEEAALEEGWHLHPSDAIAQNPALLSRQRDGKPPPKGAASRINELEAEVARLRAQLA